MRPPGGVSLPPESPLRAPRPRPPRLGFDQKDYSSVTKGVKKPTKCAASKQFSCRDRHPKKPRWAFRRKRAVTPGSVPLAPLSSSPAALHPQPKPIGPAKGGQPGADVHQGPAPDAPDDAADQGEKTWAAIRAAHHTDITQSQMADRLRGIHPKALPSPLESAPRTVTKWNSAADEKRAARTVAKDAGVQAAMKHIAAARPGTGASNCESHRPHPARGKGPTMRMMRARRSPLKPGMKPPVTTERATSIPVKITKTDRGVGCRTMFGQPKKP